MAIALCSLFGCGLSIPAGTGAIDTIVGYASCNPATHSYFRTVPGLDVRLSGPRPGLGIGWSETGVIGAGDESARSRESGGAEREASNEADPRRSAESTREGYAPPLAWTWRGVDGSTKWLGWATLRCPVRNDAIRFVHRAYVGVSLNLSEAEAGLQVGLGRTTALEATVPAASGTYVLRYQSRYPDRTILTAISQGGI